MNLELSRLVESVIQIAIDAGEAIKPFFKKEFTVQKKSDQSPVTDADMASHDLIFSALRELNVNWPILSEEGEAPSYAQRQKWPTYWLVDPLDGTREFIDHNDTFCVNIGLVSGTETILGVVYGPITGQLYYATKGGGAYKRDDNGDHAIRVSQWDEKEKIKLAVSRSHGSPPLKEFLQTVGNFELVSLGSALKMGMVAEGLIHVYPRLGPTWEWDTAAAQIILEEAGGSLTRLDFSRLLYNTKESLINPPFFAFGDIGKAGRKQIAEAVANLAF